MRLRPRSIRGTAVAVGCAAALSVSCSSGSAAIDSTTSPSAAVTTSSFSGTVQAGASDSNGFTVSATGPVAATLTAAGPPDAIVIGMAIGVPSDAGACVSLPGASVNTAAGSTAQLTGILSPDQYCIVVFDIGNDTGAVDYAVSVSHP